MQGGGMDRSAGATDSRVSATPGFAGVDSKPAPHGARPGMQRVWKALRRSAADRRAVRIT